MPMLMHRVKETVGKQAKAKSVSKLSHLKVQTHVLPQLKRGCLSSQEDFSQVTAALKQPLNFQPRA